MMKTSPKRTPLMLALLACALPAMAQVPSVQLNGQLGAGLTQKSNQTGAATLKEMSDNLLSSSYLRFGGAEDLGGGKRAIFRLEQSVAIGTGIGNVTNNTLRLWNRQSWVGIDFGAAGTVTLGRQFHAATDRAIRTLDVYNVGGSSLHVVPLGLFGVNRFAGNDSRVDNAVKYRFAAPELIDVGLSIGDGDGATTGRSYSADVAHSKKDYAFGASYVHFDAPTRIAANGVLPTHEVITLGGNAQVGPVRLYLAWIDSKLDSTVAGRLTQTNRIVDVGLSWLATPLVTVKAAYYDDSGKNLNGLAGRNGKKTTWVASGEYLLSKRTDLYAAAFQNRFTDGYKLEPVNINGLGRDPAASSTTGLSMGMRHSF